MNSNKDNSSFNNKGLINKYFKKAKRHFKIELDLQLKFEDIGYEYQKNIAPAASDSPSNTIFLCPSMFNKDILENIENLMFHEVGHAKEAEIYGKKRFFYDIYNLDNNDKITNNNKDYIRSFFNQFHDWSVDKYLFLNPNTKMKIPHFLIKRAVDFINFKKRINGFNKKFSLENCLHNYALMKFGDFKNEEEYKIIKEIFTLYPNYKLIKSFLDKNQFLDYKTKINTFPKIFNRLINDIIDEKYILRKIKLKCKEILEITELPDYLLKQDDENSIWSTFKLIIK